MITIMLAGIPIGIHNRTNLLPRLQAYVTDAEPAFTVSVTEQDLQEDGCDETYSLGYREFFGVYRKIAERLPEYDAFVFHGAAVVAEEEAYLITATSGTGKTTHAGLWLQQYPNAWILNGDKPIIRKMDGRFYACGTPWQGKENLGTRKNRPIRAIGLLHRSEKNYVSGASGQEMVQFLMHQVFLPREPAHLAGFLSLLDECCSAVPIYELHCNMDPSAATLAYETMSGRRAIDNDRNPKKN